MIHFPLLVWGVNTLGMRTIQNRIYDGIILGIAIRGSIANTRTFRVRRGNGYADSILGDIYQDQFAYTVPSSINNAEGQGARDALTAGVINWQGFSASVKENYNRRAKAKGNKMSGYNLYLKEYITANA